MYSLLQLEDSIGNTFSPTKPTENWGFLNTLSPMEPEIVDVDPTPPYNQEVGNEPSWSPSGSIDNSLSPMEAFTQTQEPFLPLNPFSIASPINQEVPNDWSPMPIAGLMTSPQHISFSWYRDQYQFDLMNFGGIFSDSFIGDMFSDSFGWENEEISPKKKRPKLEQAGDSLPRLEQAGDSLPRLEEAEDSLLPRLEEAVEGEGLCMRCKCQKSKCLMLYCGCFAAGVYCMGLGGPCGCTNCFNNAIHKDKVVAARKEIESRNPLAFVIRETTPQRKRGWRKRGCICKKSGCLMKYCRCYEAGVGCSIYCKCEACINSFGTKNQECPALVLSMDPQLEVGEE